jgi:hypothetical protein
MLKHQENLVPDLKLETFVLSTPLFLLSPRSSLTELVLAEETSPPCRTPKKIE